MTEKLFTGTLSIKSNQKTKVLNILLRLICAVVDPITKISVSHGNAHISPVARFCFLGFQSGQPQKIAICTEREILLLLTTIRQEYPFVWQPEIIKIYHEFVDRIEDSQICTSGHCLASRDAKLTRGTDLPILSSSECLILLLAYFWVPVTDLFKCKVME